MSQEQIFYAGKIPFKAVHFSHGILWMLLWGWNIGLVLSWWHMLGKRITITSQRVAVTQGIFAQRVEEVEYYRVHDTTHQYDGLLQRLVGVGTITLFSDDATAPTLSFIIPNPEYSREQIRRGVNRERQKMKTIQFD
ncbi:PH domain-containing protein [candidate division KSB3 bacterium]|uniref:PH domain-containing protein n=1 Tax=candidate division KSB3 bacterium TaxID=2044937 RepID=A0A9D5JXB2_9BACT|nr:PH domain-containing protein [candidate division KSB3 bacterium]MBD3325820.1 PH domain-containing protein [candidate division KSB3 bacterium]